MIVAMGVSSRDADQAALWLDYAGRMNDGLRIVVMMTQGITISTASALRASARRLEAEFARCPDEDESGYPKSASHLFLRTLEYCESRYPNEPVLWLEADTLPMFKGWHKAIADEYAACGKPFMGYIERGHGFAHLAGVAVYPHNWRTASPLLANVLSAPDIFWGKGKGQAFDTYAAPETVPQAAEARTIQQIWRPNLPVTEKWIRSNVKPGVALFHQIKDGSGFRAMRGILK